MDKDNIVKLGITLMLICLVAGSALAFTYLLTRGRIEEQLRERQIQALEVVLPQAVRFSEEKKGSEIDFYRGFDASGQVVGYAFLGKAKGYSSVIKVMVGIDLEGAITGIKITEQSETPGLGDKAVKAPVQETLWQAITGKKEKLKPARPWFQTHFAGKTLSGLKVVTGKTDQNIQAITGATTTSKAVTKAVKDILQAFLKQQGLEK